MPDDRIKNQRLFDAIYREMQPNTYKDLPLFESLLDPETIALVQNHGFYNVQDPATANLPSPDSDDDLLDDDPDSQGAGTPSPPRIAQDRLGWLVVQLPVLLEHLAAQGHLRSSATNVSDDPRFRRHTMGILQEQLRTHILHTCLPPGAAVWRETPRFRQLLSLLAPTSNDLTPEDWLVIRHTPLRVWRSATRSWTYPTLPTYQRGRRELPQSLVRKLPTYVQLLLIALTSAHGTTDAYEKWGVAWVPEGFYFHHRRALRTAQKDPDYKDLFAGNDWEHFALWEDPAYHEERLPYEGLQRVCIISEKATFIKGIYPQLMPFDRVHGPTILTHQAAGAASYWAPDYARVFHTTANRHDTLNAYLDVLLEIAEGTNPEKYRERGKAKRGNALGNATQPLRSTVLRSTVLSSLAVKNGRRAAGTGTPEVIKPLTFSLSTVELGWMSEFEPDFADPYFQRMRICIRKEGDYYLAVPDDIAAVFPEVASKQCYSLSRANVTEVLLGSVPTLTHSITYINPVTKVHYDLTAVARLRMPANTKRFVTKDMAAGVVDRPRQEILYLHNAMYRYPDGEFWQVLQLVMNTLDRDGKRDTRRVKYGGMLAAFAQFCCWVQAPNDAVAHDGVAADTRAVVVGDELKYLTDKTSTCPVKALTPEARLEFLYAKAECLAAPDVRDTPTPGKDGARAPRFNAYDEWVLWYARTVEIPKLNLRFTRNQYAEYMCKRWLPWRRPLSLARKLIAPTYDTYTHRAPDKDIALDVEGLIAQADAQVGFAYSAL